MTDPPRAEGFRSVVFDCDSTLASIEGIDELAGARIAEIRRLTNAAMDGSVALQEVYGRRLALIEPSRERVAALGRAYIDALVPDARETVAALQWLGKTVRVISGGLEPPVVALARELGLEADQVAAVAIRFDDAGRYAGFDDASPLARAGGKPEVVRAWRLPRRSLLVGDGSTDLEARPEVDCFAAYLGVANRPAVAAGADIVLRNSSLAPVLALAADGEERARLRGSEHAGLLERGEQLLGSGTPTASD